MRSRAGNADDGNYEDFHAYLINDIRFLGYSTIVLPLYIPNIVLIFAKIVSFYCYK